MKKSFTQKKNFGNGTTPVINKMIISLGELRMKKLMCFALIMIFQLSPVFGGDKTHSPPKKYEKIYTFARKQNQKVYHHQAVLIAKAILIFSEKYDLNPDIVTGLVSVESTFDHGASSRKRALGLMQINYKQWKDDPAFRKIVKREKDLFDPTVNIEAGCYILSTLKSKHNKNKRKYVNAYLGGKGHYERVLKSIQKFKDS